MMLGRIEHRALLNLQAILVPDTVPRPWRRVRHLLDDSSQFNRISLPSIPIDTDFIPPGKLP